ncbi:MAG: bifunctional demethylmenaquinone methyltransferase/2-methoxy-6-polyprenyl-1,4-benzoquinol methylase UbiE [Nitrospirae bacterium]|nr:bifunctional demethylmenaquinone methyltransferase/2-methoxy-6-polyprenyl-1,4-benzoquinol methylase UbiE [Nitrospirota bacterium]
MDPRQTPTQILNMPHAKRATLVKDIFSSVAPYIDPLDTAFSFGLCHVWRRKVSARVTRGEKVLDICTGTGELAKLLLKRIGPEGSLTGADFCEDMLRVARKKMSPMPKNLSLVVSDARELAFPDNTFDVATVSFGMRNVPDTVRALREIGRVLRPGGRFFCLELTRPGKRWILPFYKFYVFKIMPSIAKAVTKNSLPYTYLPKSIEAFYPPAEFKKLMSSCGFVDVKAKSLSLGIATLYGAAKSS